MKRPNNILISAALFMSCNVGFADGVADLVEQDEQTEQLSPSAQTPLPIEQIRNFSEIFTIIKQSYVEDVSDEELLDYAITGMLQGLDPHSSYYKEEDYYDLNESTKGRFGGLGIEVMMEKGLIKVVAPIDDTPAARAGMQTGDLIIRIDDKPINGLNLQQATEQLRGEPGTDVKITVVRDTEPEPFDLVLQRDIIQVKVVKREWLNDSIGYLRITQFQLTTSEIFRKELKRMAAQDKFAGLIIDLRNNPGGLLNSAVSIADMFIEEGVLLKTKGRVHQVNHEYEATSSDLLKGKPLVVLINGGSASASEIVAGAIQDHQRGVLVGTQSFGKGSIQTVLDVGDKDGIKLTTGRYYTPSGRSIQAEGITPDIIVEQREYKEKKSAFQAVKEGDLHGHLENDGQANSQNSKTQNSLLEDDLQLQEALNIMTAAIIFARDPEPSNDDVNAAN